MGEKGGERTGEREKEEEEEEEETTTVGERDDGRRRERAPRRGVEALAAQKARMQAKKEERDEETGFFQLGQVGASNLGTAASLRE